MEKKFVANKAVLVNPEGKILFVHDAGKADHIGAARHLDFPGGRMEERESPLEGLAREVKEEIGIKIDVTKARPFHVGLWGPGGDVENNPIVGIFYIVPVGEIHVTLSEEHSHYFWFDPRQALPPDVSAHMFIQDALDAYRRTEGIVIAAETKKGREGYGLVQVFTGNGKGKTTAGLGEAIRAVGAGKKVGIVYFDKGGSTHYSERCVLDELRGRMDYVVTGRDRIDPKTGRFDFSVTDVDYTEAKRGVEEARKMFKGNYDVVVLDEINSTTDLGMLKVEDVFDLLKEKPDRLEVVMTGRNAPDVFLERADLVTEMKLRKHYFYSGVPAREGLDF